jgi:hypothetical protein
MLSRGFIAWWADGPGGVSTKVHALCLLQLEGVRVHVALHAAS